MQPGDTVFVRAGTYTESVTIGMSGSAAAGPVTFQNYPGEKAILDGTGLKPPTDQNGLFNIIGRSYVTIAGFEIRNYVTSSSSAVPAGIWVTGSGSHIKILNNIVHDIKPRPKPRERFWNRCLWIRGASIDRPGHDRRQRGLQPKDRWQRIGERRWERDQLRDH